MRRVRYGEPTVEVALPADAAGFAGATDAVTPAALRESPANKWNFYAPRMLASAIAGRYFSELRALSGILGRRAKKVLPRPIVKSIQWVRGRQYRIPVGAVRFGDLKRLSPIGVGFGWDRGPPIDRYYIESFLAKNAEDIRGRVLEAGDDRYTVRFGGGRIERSDVVCVETANPRATIVGDLAEAGVLPEAAFDCIVLTQALQYFFDLRATVAALYRALKPGGVLLVTVPGVSQSDQKPWTWYWTFTAPAVRRLFEGQFGRDGVTVEAHGNVFAATAFLYGLAIEEIDISDLNVDDTNFPVIVAARAIKRKDE